MKISGSFIDKIQFSSDLKLADIEPYFVNFNNQDWEYLNSGYFISRKNELEIKLHYVYCFDIGISFRYDITMSNVEQEKTYYSVGNFNEINVFIDAADEYFVPKGSCIAINVAWQVISDFFKNPLEKSTKIDWIDSDKIDWTPINNLY